MDRRDTNIGGHRRLGALVELGLEAGSISAYRPAADGGEKESAMERGWATPAIATAVVSNATCTRRNQRKFICITLYVNGLRPCLPWCCPHDAHCLQWAGAASDWVRHIILILWI